MDATFRVDGRHEFEIRGDGSTVSADNKLQGMHPGHIAIQIHRTQLSVPEPAGRDIPDRETVAMFTMKPSIARAVASALLSAATEAKK